MEQRLATPSLLAPRADCENSPEHPSTPQPALESLARRKPAPETKPSVRSRSEWGPQRAATESPRTSRKSGWRPDSHSRSERSASSSRSRTEDEFRTEPIHSLRHLGTRMQSEPRGIRKNIMWRGHSCLRATGSKHRGKNGTEAKPKHERISPPPQRASAQSAVKAPSTRRRKQKRQVINPDVKSASS